MSDRKLVLEIDVCSGNSLKLFMDGESGTWRLFIAPEHACADLSLEALTRLRDELTRVVADIALYPDNFNAEVRKLWEVEDNRP